MFGAFGRSLTESAVTFVSKSALDAAVGHHLQLNRPLIAVEGTRSVTKADMILNDLTLTSRWILKPTKSAPTASF